MKWTFATLVSNEYLDMALTLIHSIEKNSKLNDFSFMILHSENWCKLSEKSMTKLKALYWNIDFVKCEESHYEHIEMDNAMECFGNQDDDRDPKSARAWLLKFEILRKNGFGYDKVIWIDSDMLCLGDLTWLANVQADFGVTVRDRKGGKTIRYAGSNKINAGLMVLGRDMLNLESWSEMVKLRENLRDEYPSGDQIAWQKYFTGKPFLAIPKKYNDFPANYKNGSRLIHFFSTKPGEKKKKDLKPHDELWLKYRDEAYGN